ncbi:MAG TPA: ATP-binding cassette domain-containing protein [Thermotogota bacterium]|nr:ATP-binding cassette domain-containing protein [Thermotogota bacterium]HPJ89063.1 ATP-binding cassette domain-containing protein [Thermotogota bacterium]HPR95123.1 ATP-binding cassette domain-containing protein [Thermotogota bacterium]
MLKLENITVVYNPGQDNEKVALKEVNLTANKRDFVVIVGSNGAGKSTLLNVILGKLTPTGGTYSLKEKNISKPSISKMANMIGRVYQNPNSGVFSNLSIRENLKIASKKGRRGLTFSKIKPEAITLLKELNMGLENRMNTIVGELSGGQKQALAMVMAVITNPEVLLLDEHTASLDPKSAERVMELTKMINEEMDVTILMITHNMKFAEDYGNRKVQIREGVLNELKGNQPSVIYAM